MFFWTQQNLKSNQDEKFRHDLLDLNNPSWIIDHHRENLIKKISKPVDFRLDLLLAQIPRTNNDPDYNGNKPSNKPVTEETKLELGNGQPKRSGLYTNNKREESGLSYRINLSELQRLRLRQLQQKLIRHAVDLRYDVMEPSGWAEDLREYVQALQDYEYMAKHTLNTSDPFIITGERYIDRLMLEVSMRGKEDEEDPLHTERSATKWETTATQVKPVGGTRDGNFRQAWIRGFRRRLGVAAISGIFLIAPMWLMVLHRTLYTGLVSTTVFVAVFGVAMALFLDELKDVMASTAAYSAVLVVFVGLTVSSNAS